MFTRTAILASLALVAALAMLPVVSAKADRLCFSDRRVTQIYTGYVQGGMGADGGDAVYFTLDNGLTYALDRSYNLDWPRGQALHKTLLTAMAGGYRIHGRDHYGGECSDVQEIMIKR